MRGYECSTCGGLCDPGELENGVCFDCRTEAERRKKQEIETRRETSRLMQARYREQNDGQMAIEIT